MNIHIYVSYHKDFLFIPDEAFIPIQVGRALKPLLLPIIGDDTGDNISEMNPKFSDVVTHYWAWKNDPGCDYIGFFHYRRYFCFKNPSPGSNPEVNFIREYGLNKADIENAIKGYDIIVPRALNVGNMYNNTCNPFGPAWADTLIAKMKEVKPEYSDAIDEFYTSGSAYLYNLHIMKRELFDEFCEFTFGTLIPLANTIGAMPPYSTFSRFFGYVAEQFINIYIIHLRKTRGVKVLELDPLKLFESDYGYTAMRGYY